ncbi:MAG: response regulator [Albidovulum sp.]
MDDHPVLLAGLSSLFTSCDDMIVIGTGATAAAAIELVERYDPDVLIMDVRLPGDAIKATARIVESGRKTHVLFFTAADDPEIAILGMEAGALGYVLKGSRADELIQAVRMVHAGESYITPGFAARIVAGLRTANKPSPGSETLHLTVREEQVLRLLRQGSTNREIGIALRISEKTVKNYMTTLMQKLHARNRIEVVLAAQARDTDPHLHARHLTS